MPSLESLLQKGYILPPKDLCQSLYRKDEVVAGGSPACAAFAERAAGDEAMEVDVEAQLLVPGMQEGDEADLPAQAMLRVAAEGLERLRTGSEEPVAEGFLVVERPRVGGVGAIAAGVVRGALKAAGIATLQMPAEGGSAAGGDGLHHLRLIRRQGMDTTIRRPVQSKHLGHFPTRTGFPCRPTTA